MPSPMCAAAAAERASLAEARIDQWHIVSQTTAVVLFHAINMEHEMSCSSHSLCTVSDLLAAVQ